MVSFRRLSIQRQVVLSALLLFLPVVAGAAWSATRLWQERAADVRQEAAAAAATSASYVDEYLRAVDAMAFVLAHDPSVVGLNRPACDRLFAAVLHEQPLLVNVFLQAPDGTIKGSGIQAADQPPLSLPHVREVLKTGRPALSDLTVGPATQKPTILFGYPVPADDDGTSMAGVLTLGLDLAALESRLKDLLPANGSTVTLTTDRGLVLARSRDAERYIGTTVEIPQPTDPGAEPRTSILADRDGVERIVASALVHRGSWLVSVGIPRSVILVRLWPLWRRNLVIVATTVLLSFLFSLWVGDHLARQLNHLRTAAQRIAGGDLSPVDPGPSLNKELSELQSAFRTMAENLRGALQALDRQVVQERQTREALETLQRQVVRQERLAAVGLLVSGVAHELNNPLQAILGASELLEHRHELSGEGLQDVALVKTQSHRASEIIRSLSRLGAPRLAEPAIVDVHDVVAEVVQLRFADLDSADIAYDVDLTSTGKVHANFTEIEQVVLNLVVNAEQAVQASAVSPRRLIIRSRDVGSSVRLEVLDNGPGVLPEDEAKLFQPFFTTKPVGEGTGLGLSVSYGIIESYGGTMGYQRNEWGGATFFFELPRS